MTDSELSWGGKAGARSAYLEVLEDNKNAIAFYRGLGFARAYSYWFRCDRVE